MAEFEEMMRTAGLAGLCVFGLLFLARLWWGWRTRKARGHLFAAGPAVMSLQVLSMAALALIGFGVLMFLFVVQRGTMFMPFPVQAGLAIVFSGYILLELFLAAWPRRRALWLRAIGALGMAGVGALGLLLSNAALGAFAYPPEDEGVVLARVPFEGEWMATGAGGSGATNHHDRIASQKYAADLAALCADGRAFRGAGVTHEESCTFGARVLSPVDGVVAHVLDGLPDGESKQVLPGNHVVIRFGEDHYVALAHFQQGSILVREGDAVRAGQEIARAGNSGNSDFAHLHIHVQDGPVYDIRASKALPYRFAEMERRRFLWWARVRGGYLLSNDRVRPAS
ncbi:MAG: peptidoglycan DD-metalloendopeptidase family protein [Terricaulis sp.]|nr:peptidoglycan DD-metalloendopeptidase family protein [Terricaulis sp.]